MSVLAVLAWARVMAGTYELRWVEASRLMVKGPPSSTAVVESTGDMDGPWTALAEVALGADGVGSMEVALGDERRFYRAASGGGLAGPKGFAWIPPGSFVMGSPEDEADRQPDEVQRVVVLSRGFWLSHHEVTQAQYESVMGVNPARFKGDAQRPVETVSWHEAVRYCRVLTERERAAGTLPEGMAYRLPTEAEWEYACRAGNTNRFHFGHEVEAGDAYAWTAENCDATTHPVGLKKPNDWGLHDMHGNVWEWCSDWFEPYPPKALVDPTGPPSTGTNKYKVFKGGGWNQDLVYGGASSRFMMPPASGIHFVGFRVVLAPR